MRAITLTAIFAALALGACHAPKPVYTPAQRDSMVALFERYCTEPAISTDEDERGCPVSLIVYHLNNGQEYVGEVFRLNRRTGRLRVSWSPGSPSEDFYPGSSQVLPGKITKIASGNRDDLNAAEWITLYDRLKYQSPTTMLR